MKRRFVSVLLACAAWLPAQEPPRRVLESAVVEGHDRDALLQGIAITDAAVGLMRGTPARSAWVAFAGPAAEAELRRCGWLDARARADWDTDGDRLRVRIETGVQYRMGKVQIAGDHPLPEATPVSKLEALGGSSIVECRDRVDAFVREVGKACEGAGDEIQVVVRWHAVGDDVADLVVELTATKFMRIGVLTLTGEVDDATRDAVLGRLQFAVGLPANRPSVDRIRTALRSLLRYHTIQCGRETRPDDNSETLAIRVGVADYALALGEEPPPELAVLQRAVERVRSGKTGDMVLHTRFPVTEIAPGGGEVWVSSQCSLLEMRDYEVLGRNVGTVQLWIDPTETGICMQQRHRALIWQTIGAPQAGVLLRPEGRSGSYFQSSFSFRESSTVSMFDVSVDDMVLLRLLRQGIAQVKRDDGELVVGLPIGELRIDTASGRMRGKLDADGIVIELLELDMAAMIAERKERWSKGGIVLASGTAPPPLGSAAGMLQIGQLIADLLPQDLVENPLVKAIGRAKVPELPPGRRVPPPSVRGFANQIVWHFADRFGGWTDVLFRGGHQLAQAQSAEQARAAARQLTVEWRAAEPGPLAALLASFALWEGAPALQTWIAEGGLRRLDAALAVRDIDVLFAAECRLGGLLAAYGAALRTDPAAMALLKDLPAQATDRDVALAAIAALWQAGLGDLVEAALRDAAR